MVKKGKRSLTSSRPPFDGADGRAVDDEFLCGGVVGGGGLQTSDKGSFKESDGHRERKKKRGIERERERQRKREIPPKQTQRWEKLH